MRLKTASPATLAILLVILASGIFLSSCTITRTGNDISLPVITVSPMSATVQAGASVQFTATVAARSARRRLGL
jgi:hypothetical protein